MRLRQAKLDDSCVASQSYVEIDEWSLFQANNTLLVTDREKGTQTDLLDNDHYPPERASDVSGLTVDVFGTSWNAVHHSLDGKHLVAVSAAGELIWFRNYRQLCSGQATREQFYQSVVVLKKKRSFTPVSMDNLCVENGRGRSEILCRSETTTLSNKPSAHTVAFTTRVGNLSRPCL